MGVLTQTPSRIPSRSPRSWEPVMMQTAFHVKRAELYSVIDESPSWKKVARARHSCINGDREAVLTSGNLDKLYRRNRITYSVCHTDVLSLSSLRLLKILSICTLHDCNALKSRLFDRPVQRLSISGIAFGPEEYGRGQLQRTGLCWRCR
jgi:hypothetical protein